MSYRYSVLQRPRARAATTALLLTTVAVTAAAPSTAVAQEAEELPALVVETDNTKKKRKKVNPTETRLTDVGSADAGGQTGAAAASGSGASVAGGGGVTGASTTIITRAQIERAPQSSLAEIIGREAGVQTSSLFGGMNGAGTKVDVRGFGATSSNNTLLLINGRRQNDWDLEGFDLSTISKDSIERVEITRGNSAAVLYGDGAVGGVINIVTRSGTDLPSQVRVEGGLGSLGTKEGNVTASASSGNFAALLSGSHYDSDGYRINGDQKQSSAVGDFRWTFAKGSVFLNLGADDQELGLPGGRTIAPLFGINEALTDPKGTGTPFNYGDRQGLRATTGFTYMLVPGLELVVDGGVRTKWQQAGFFSFTGTPQGYLDTELTTTSLTPRANLTLPLFGLPSRGVAGIDFYDTDYSSKRTPLKGAPPHTIIDATQETIAGYWQQTVSVLPTTDISAGGRIQRSKTTSDNILSATDIPLDDSETNHAWHVGAEHRLLPGLTVFGRLAESFRVPNVDERGYTIAFPTTDYVLRTQKSDDWEIGARVQLGTFEIQSSYYSMNLTDELFYSPAANGGFGANVNLDPTRRRGVETLAIWQVIKDVRLRGNVTYTDAEFSDGPFSGNRIPLVAEWTGNIGVSWDIVERWLTLDASVNYVGERHMDADEANELPYLEDYTTVDLRLGGEVDQFFWSASVQNVFDVDYYSYAVNFGGGFSAAYPLPGRTFMVKAGTKW